jgi:hypothetical protein
MEQAFNWYLLTGKGMFKIDDNLFSPKQIDQRLFLLCYYFCPWPVKEESTELLCLKVTRTS